MSVCTIAGQSDLVSAHINKKELLKICSVHASGFLREHLEGAAVCVCGCARMSSIIAVQTAQYRFRRGVKEIMNLVLCYMHINSTIPQDLNWK